MTSPLCLIGLHSWPRVHGFWREVTQSPATSNCVHCDKPLSSVWRSVYPSDGSRCSPGSCPDHNATAKLQRKAA